MDKYQIVLSAEALEELKAIVAPQADDFPALAEVVDGERWIRLDPDTA